MPPANMSYAEVDVSTTAGPITSIPDFARRAFIQPSVAVRFRNDETNPTTSVGFRLPADAVVELCEAEIEASRWITESGSGKLRILYYRD